MYSFFFFFFFWGGGGWGGNHCEIIGKQSLCSLPPKYSGTPSKTRLRPKHQEQAVVKVASVQDVSNQLLNNVSTRLKSRSFAWLNAIYNYLFFLSFRTQPCDLEIRSRSKNRHEHLTLSRNYHHVEFERYHIHSARMRNRQRSGFCKSRKCSYLQLPKIPTPKSPKS